MRETDTEMLITIFGGKDLIANALGLTNYDHDTQKLILGRFCECVFKRALLDVPSTYMGSMIEIFETHRASGRQFAALVDELRVIIPDMERYMQEEIARAVEEFRLSDRSVA